MAIELLDLLLANLRQDIPKGFSEYMSQESAYLQLKRVSGQDFGYDIQAWEAWCEEETRRSAEEIHMFFDEHNITTWDQYKKLRRNL